MRQQGWQTGRLTPGTLKMLQVFCKVLCQLHGVHTNWLAADGSVDCGAERHHRGQLRSLLFYYDSSATLSASCQWSSRSTQCIAKTARALACRIATPPSKVSGARTLAHLSLSSSCSLARRIGLQALLRLESKVFEHKRAPCPCSG